MASLTFTVEVTREADGSLWAHVNELPGCFASGFTLEELQEATVEAMQLWLPDGITFDEAVWKVLNDTPKEDENESSGAMQRMLVCA